MPRGVSVSKHVCQHAISSKEGLNKPSRYKMYMYENDSYKGPMHFQNESDTQIEHLNHKQGHIHAPRLSFQKERMEHVSCD